jgi:hypothetical protein
MLGDGPHRPRAGPPPGGGAGPARSGSGRRDGPGSPRRGSVDGAPGPGGTPRRRHSRAHRLRGSADAGDRPLAGAALRRRGTRGEELGRHRRPRRGTPTSGPSRAAAVGDGCRPRVRPRRGSPLADETAVHRVDPPRSGRPDEPGVAPARPGRLPRTHAHGTRSPGGDRCRHLPHGGRPPRAGRRPRPRGGAGGSRRPARLGEGSGRRPIAALDRGPARRRDRAPDARGALPVLRTTGHR